MVWMKKIFNRVFSEEQKGRFRNRFWRLFLMFDKVLIYMYYLKACHYILQNMIFRDGKEDYAYRYSQFCENVKEEYIKSKITHEKFPVRDAEMEACIEYIGKNGCDVYCGSLNGIQPYTERDVGYDPENGLFWGMYENKKLYFSRDIASAGQALSHLNGLAAEQSENSPHLYLTKEFQVSYDDVVFDVGCADGNFALSVIERVREVYLFEVEDIWLKPLELTFRPYKEKVHIIQKCVSKSSDTLAVSLDDFCRERHIGSIGLLKLDVEGCEKDVLLGASEMLREGRIKKIAVCTYHKMDDEKMLGALLPNYRKTMSEGYMLGAMLQDIWDIKPPYFTKGLMRACLDEEGG